MEELEISGKRYISTRRAAREHGYHSDYMGQLIRGKKVTGKKVGRSWYIEEESLGVYLGLAKPEAPKVVIKEPEPAQPERVVPQEPVPSVAPAPVFADNKVSDAPAALRVDNTEPEEKISQDVQKDEDAVEEVEERVTRIPVHTPRAVPQAVQYVGGLRYAHDDTPVIPAIVRTHQVQQYAPIAQPLPTPKRFPYVSLFLVAVIALCGAAFASNFVSATIVSEQGKAATIQYAIHW